MKVKLHAAGVAAAAFLSVSSALATTIVLPTDAQLVSKSPLIVVGRVVRSEPVDRHGAIWTETEIQVERSLKGISSSTLVVREIGGRVGERESVIFGAPKYATGEHVLTFLTPTPRGDYQTMDLFVGKFTERTTREGAIVWYRDDSSDGVRLLDSNFKALATSDAQRVANRFESFIRSTTRGETASNDYFIQHPQWPARLQGNFTLIDDPNVYRWFAFDSGTQVAWRSVGQQTGYGSGGVSELQTAMNSWSGYSSANIRYTYAGAGGSGGASLNNPNGINEVIFNDPLGEIAGTWNPTTGGVVGVGGFNNISAGGSFTGPFDADATHRARAYNAQNILEGNLVIQDGVSPSKSISSFTLSEIIAHELGHTLGFGHSADNTALMYFQVTGLGPGLRSDDQAAARWLYPNGGGPAPTVPAAPSNLTVTVNGTTASLSWKDNATDETSQTIYASQAGGSFASLGAVGANVTSFAASQLVKGRSYVFRVTASNAAGESAPSNSASITVPSDTLQPSFRTTPVTGTAGRTTFSFIDQSTGPIVSWHWDFGDGGTSSSQNPTHLYANAGTFSAMLTIASSTGQASTSKSIVITSANAPVTAAFSFTPVAPSVIDTVSFVDESTGPVNAWHWDFGDGSSSSTDQNPSHRYTATGSYSVKLDVTGSTGTSTLTRTVVVNNGSGGNTVVEADFDASSFSPGTDEVVAFYDRSTGTPNGFYWEFGDGGTSTQQNPTHKFTTAGTFTVKLTAGNSTSSSNKTRSVSAIAASSLWRSIIPVASRTSGANASSWRTELSVFNNGSSAATVIATYLPSAGESSLSKSFAVAAGASVTYANALQDLFALNSGAGAIALQATSASNGAPNLRAASRTFTGSASGTYGQFVPEVPGATSAATTYITGLQSTDSYRTNIGLVNSSAVALEATLTLSGESGNIFGQKKVTVAGRSFQQGPLSAFFTVPNGTSNLSVKIEASPAGSLFSYVSIVDNRTQDPIYIAATSKASNNELVIPAVARAAGTGGTFWRSDVTLHNPALTTISVNLTFLRAGADNRSASSKALSIGAGATTTISDITTDLGVGDASGALAVTWSGANAPIVTSRTYTTRSSDQGSFGQSIDPAGAFGSDTVVTGIRSDASYRTNIGLVNRGNTAANVTLKLLAEDGHTLATKTTSLLPQSQIQTALGALFGIDTSSLGAVTMTAHSDAATLFAYGSVVDNVSGDPIFAAGR